MLNISTEEVLNFDTATLWNTFLTLNEECEGEYNNERLQIENGIKLKFPIWYITQTWYELYPSSKRVKIYGHGKKNIAEFMKEVEERNKIMRQIILQEIQEEEITKPR